MVPCPVPLPEEWDPAMADRLRLLQLRGLGPQLFLPAAALEAHPAGCRGKRGGQRRRWWWRRRRAVAPEGAGAGGTGDLPEEAYQVLEAFLLEPRQLAVELARAEASQAAGEAGAAPSSGAVAQSLSAGAGLAGTMPAGCAAHADLRSPGCLNHPATPPPLPQRTGRGCGWPR